MARGGKLAFLPSGAAPISTSMHSAWSSKTVMLVPSREDVGDRSFPATDLDVEHTGIQERDDVHASFFPATLRRLVGMTAVVSICIVMKS